MFVDTLSKLTGDLTLVPKKISQLLFKSLSTITQLNTRHGNNTEIIFSRMEYELQVTLNAFNSICIHQDACNYILPAQKIVN